MLEGMITQRQTTHCSGFRDVGGMIRRHHYFEFQVNNTQIIIGQFSTIAGKSISVDWGDGSARSTYSGTDQAWSKDYGSAGDRTVRMFGAVALTKFKMDVAGANISFDLANLPASLTYFSCGGNNVVTGDLASLPASLTSFDCGGNNIIADYTTKAWITKPATVHFVPVAPGGLSTAEIDQLLIDLDNDLVWAAGNAITLTGTNAARSTDSDAAVTSMTNEGATVTTN